MVTTEVAVGALSCLGVGVQGGLVLLQELLLHCDIMVGDTENGEAVLRLLDFSLYLISFVHLLLLLDLGNELILNQDQGLHRVLQGELVLAHLAQDGANVEVDISRVEHLQAVVDAVVAEMEVVIFNFQGFLQIAEGGPQLLSSSENASEVIVCNSPVLVAFFGQGLCLLQKLEGNVEVLFLEEAHRKNVANDGGLLAGFHNSF
mmetsp:Transcript_7139/g.11284  ORF Transcript_7139/g.11284 Transcript_7139/m.11284 type:complete len:204 (+) Transcript_7139:206-817(+)|eukprot:CAMPEP_0170495176 /NCGR_PEP_ID=MMETSP0208-20121228/15058_1 /TAXON_ID=197538 /ORGANISM="Strombidium inclinatum, Strain S3" /LENGTH=203 /DNA_ID=CAMNT_0010771329 /DNA_START=204 /DNA_END=815 /DNA_ORIENTATION=+